MFENLKEKSKKNKVLKQAFRKAEDPMWFIEYVLVDDTCGQLNVFADSYKKAKSKAASILNNLYPNQYWKITNISVI